MKKYSTCTVQYRYCTVSCTVLRDDRTIKIMLFHQSAAYTMTKRVIVTHFTMKIMCTYLYITCNKKILLQNILACCGYSPTSPVFLLRSEHKHCDNVATNSNSENTRSRIVVSLWASVGTGTNEDESSTGCFWAAGFHHVMARSRLARVLKIMNRLFL
jgi:hypothetical protein